MKGYVEKVEINDDQSARFVVYVPKLLGSQYAVLRAVWQSCALAIISIRPTPRAGDTATPTQAGKRGITK